MRRPKKKLDPSNYTRTIDVKGDLDLAFGLEARLRRLRAVRDVEELENDIEDMRYERKRTLARRAKEKA